MTPRQHTILRSVVREHIRTGEPVGSALLRERARLPVSAATVRVELAFLEEEGYLSQPHTSAGREPTTAGYRYYVDHCIARSPSPAAAERFGELGRPQWEGGEELLARSLTRTLARLAGTLAVVALPERSVYEAGFGSVFRMRELADDPTASELERLLDVFEDEPASVTELASAGVSVFIDGEIPFVRTRRVSMVVASPVLPSGASLFAALIGPVRMPYDRHISVLEALRQAFTDSGASRTCGAQSTPLTSV